MSNVTQNTINNGSLYCFVVKSLVAAVGLLQGRITCGASPLDILCVCVCETVNLQAAGPRKAQSALLPQFIPTEAHSLGTETLDMDKLCVLLLTLAALLPCRPILAASVYQGAKGTFVSTTSIIFIFNR